jgi:oligosaccharide repeat unit polymerase
VLAPLLLPYSPGYGAVFLALLALVFQSGEWQLCARDNSFTLPSRTVAPELFRLGAFLGAGAGVLASVLRVQQTGASVAALRLSDFASVSNEAAVLRYQTGGRDELTGFIVLLLAALYFGSVCAGILAAKAPEARVAVAAPIAAAVLLTLVTTARATMLTALLLLASGYLATRSAGSGARPSKRGALQVGAAVIVAVVVFFGSAILRVGGYDSTLTSTLVDKTQVAAVGHVPAFDQYMAAAIHDNEIGVIRLGVRYTVNPLQVLAGGDDLVQGVYLDRYTVSDRGASTNVFTWGRGLIEDFGIAGALLLVYLLGLISGAATTAYSRRQGAFAWTVLMALYAVILWSHVVSILSYQTVVVAVMGSGVVMARAERPRKTARPEWSHAHRALGPPAYGATPESLAN